MKSVSKSTEGFTLVELLVTLSLLSIMAIYAFNAFGLTGKMKTIASSVEKDAEVQTVLRHFHEEVSALTPVYRQDAAGSAKLIFEGRETSLSYVDFADGTKEIGGLYQVTWQLNVKRQLTIERHLLRAKSLKNIALVVLEDVEAVTFTYSEVKTSWLDQQRLPNVVALKLELLNKKSTTEVAASIVSGQ
jgi:prepilin-type N-terminal cleavage/methylation domain-containing protein